MKTRILLTVLLLQGCQTVPDAPPEQVGIKPEPTNLEWLRVKCDLYGVVSFKNTDQQMAFKVPVDICGRGA